MISKSEIIDLLKTIQYPGFSRDIVSFGLIKNIQIDGVNISLELALKSNDPKVVDELKNKIHSIITKQEKVGSLSIKIDVDEIDSNFKEAKINGIKNIIAVGSAKGGVGKSTIAINIASQLSKNNKVGLLDLDIYGPSLPLMVGENATPKIIQNQLIPIEKYNMKLMSFGFLNQGNAPAIWRGPMVAKLTNQFFDNVDWGELDFLIIDLPPGTGDIQLTLAQKLSLDGAIIVTTPQEISLEDVRKGSEMFKKVNVPIIGIIENMSKLLISGKFINKGNQELGDLIIDNQKVNISKNGEFKLEYKVFDGPGGLSESSRLNVPLLGEICMDPKLAISVDNGTPFVLEHINNDITKEFEKIELKIKNELNA